MPFTCWRNLTTLVPVSGTVSTPRLLKSLSVPPTFGAFSDGARITRQRLLQDALGRAFRVEIFRLAGDEPERRRCRALGLSASKMPRPFASVTCIASALKPRAAGARAVFAFFAFLAMVAS